MNLFPKNIWFNGRQTSIQTLLESTAKTDWQNEFLSFLKAWYNNDDSITVQTSGSTGTPKQIILKKTFIAESAARTVQFFGLKKGDRILHVLPSRYIAGKLMLVRALIGELDLYLADPAGDFRILETQSFRFSAMVVNQVEKLLSTVPNPKLDFLLIGGSAIPPRLEDKLQQSATRCYSSYAMTETATHIAVRALNGTSRSKSYHCLNGISVALNQRGCIRIFMPGLENEFIDTNDLGKISTAKSFKVLGRSDNMIVSGGIKFSPEILEEKLAQHLSVPYAISSKPDSRLGEKIVLVLECKSSEVLKSTLETQFGNVLTKYERPREIVFVHQLPRTENGKISRKVLRNTLHV